MKTETTTSRAGVAAPCSAVLLSIVSTPEARNQIDTVEKAQDLIDGFEEVFDHGEMPPSYDWLIARRDRLHFSQNEMAKTECCDKTALSEELIRSLSFPDSYDKKALSEALTSVLGDTNVTPVSN